MVFRHSTSQISRHSVSDFFLKSRQDTLVQISNHCWTNLDLDLGQNQISDIWIIGIYCLQHLVLGGRGHWFTGSQFESLRLLDFFGFFRIISVNTSEKEQQTPPLHPWLSRWKENVVYIPSHLRRSKKGKNKLDWNGWPQVEVEKIGSLS